jgi:hypothetical protein
MESPAHKLLLPAAIAIAAVALPATAVAEPIVPPENSAATQYTEAIPTGGGQKDAGKSGNGKKRTPSSVLGSQKTKKLNAQGPQGHAAAEVAAETAPPPVEATSEAAAGPAPKSGEPAPAPSHSAARGEPKAHAGNATSERAPRLDASGGSSGLGEVLAQATGASSGGELGLLLPLLLLTTLIWALLYGLRQKRPVT